MKRPFFHRVIAATVLIGAVLGTASVAQARPDVQVFIRAEPVYVQPRPVYEAPPVVVYERPWRSWHRHASWQRYAYDQDHDGVPDRYDRDRDGDGVPNRYDRRPDNPYRR
jgi:uncharacterized protein YraI